MKFQFLFIADGNIPEWAEGCKHAPADLHRQCAAEHYGEIPRASWDPEWLVLFNSV